MLKEFAGRTWSVSWPMTLIMSFEFLIGLADVYIAGRVGKEVQAAYGFIIQLYFVFIIAGNALTVGSVSVISRLFASDDREALGEAIYSAVVITFIAGTVLGVLGIILTGTIISALSIPPDLKPLATSLGRIYAAGLFFHYGLIQINGILRACARVKTSMVTMALVCACNISLAFFLVFRTSLGYRGIAVATAVSVCMGGLLNLYHVRGLLKGVRRFSRGVTKAIITIGWPSGLAQVLWQAHSMVIFMILSSMTEHNVEVLAALSAGLRIESAIFLPAFAFNMANAVIVGNLLGERKEEEAFKGGIVTALVGVPIVIALTALVIFNARSIAAMLSNNPVVIRETVHYLYIIMLSEPFMAWAIILGGGLMGAGDTRGVMIMMGLSLWVVRVPLCYVFVVLLGFGATSVWWTMNASQFIMACLITWRYFGKRWLRVGLIS